MTTARALRMKDSYLIMLLAIIISANLLVILEFLLPGKMRHLHSNLTFVVPLTNVIVISILLACFTPLREVKKIKPREPGTSLLSPDQALFQLFAEKSNDMILLNDQNGTILYINPATCRLLDYRKEEIVGKQVSRFIAPADWDDVRHDTEAAAQGKTIAPREMRLLRKDGTLIDAETRGFTLQKEGQNYIGAILRDISNPKKNDQLLAVQRDWEQLFNTITDFVSVHDRDFKIIRVNNALCDFLGKKPEEIIGQSCYRLFHAADAPIAECPHSKAVLTGHPVSVEINDPYMGFPLRVTCSPFFDSQDRLMGTVHVARTVGDGTAILPTASRDKLIAICASCKSIREDKNTWMRIEDYVHQHYGGRFTHSICPSCQQKLYPQFTDS